MTASNLPGLTCGIDCTTEAVEQLNSRCFCVGMEPGALEGALRADDGTAEVASLIAERCPHLFANQAVFVASAQLRRMAELVSAIESVVAMPAYRAAVLAA